MEAFTFNTFELILLSAAGVLLVIQLFYYLGIYNRIHTRNIADKKKRTALYQRASSSIGHYLCTQ